MLFHLPTAEIFIPDGATVEEALARTTHMAVGAHPDDLEIMAAHGILKCFQRRDQWFTGVVLTDGSGSPREGRYANCSDEAMKTLRREEQKKAAAIGEYGACAFLDYSSSAVKDNRDARPMQDLAILLALAKPKFVYTHNLADKHDTHVSVALRTLAALRSLPTDQRPSKVYGCEVWRDLDWMVDSDKVTLDVSAREDLQNTLLGTFASQIQGGKRYDLATLGRRKAHATYHTSHGTDAAMGLDFAMDLTPLMEDPNLDVEAYVLTHIEHFRQDVKERIRKSIN